jgi:GAF domain-containing protein
LSRKDAKGRTRGSKLRSTRTKRAKRVGSTRQRRPNLQQQLDACRHELAQARGQLFEALEQQAAASEVLKVISDSPGELKPVFDNMLANAVRICGAAFGSMLLREGNMFRRVALYNAPREYADSVQKEPLFATSRTLARVLAAKQAAQVADMAVSEPASQIVRLARARTLLNVPMIKDSEVIGVIGIYRQETRPFTDKQIELVSNFAAQAVIAIENTRLLNELRASLQQQTATADVLRVISSSPGQLEPVFEAMLGNATRLCEAAFGSMLLLEGDEFRRVALHNAPPPFAEFSAKRPRIRASAGWGLAPVVATKQAVHIADTTVECPNEPIAIYAGARTLLIMPMLKEDELIGMLGIYRQEVRPFTDKQIELGPVDIYRIHSGPPV